MLHLLELQTHPGNMWNLLGASMCLYCNISLRIYWNRTRSIMCLNCNTPWEYVKLTLDSSCAWICNTPWKYLDNLISDPSCAPELQHHPGKKLYSEHHVLECKHTLGISWNLLDSNHVLDICHDHMVGNAMWTTYSELSCAWIATHPGKKLVLGCIMCLNCNTPWKNMWNLLGASCAWIATHPGEICETYSEHHVLELQHTLEKYVKLTRSIMCLNCNTPWKNMWNLLGESCAWIATHPGRIYETYSEHHVLELQQTLEEYVKLTRRIMCLNCNTPWKNIWNLLRASCAWIATNPGRICETYSEHHVLELQHTLEEYVKLTRSIMCLNCNTPWKICETYSEHHVLELQHTLEKYVKLTRSIMCLNCNTPWKNMWNLLGASCAWTFVKQIPQNSWQLARSVDDFLVSDDDEQIYWLIIRLQINGVNGVNFVKKINWR